jgi:uncharacterized membrane protein YphA (DoxX/SURF4 family)
MAIKQHSGGVDFGLLLERLAVGGYVALAGLGKLGIFSVKKPDSADAATQPAGEPAATQSAEQVLPEISFQWPGFGAMWDKVAQFANMGVVQSDGRPSWLPETLARIYGCAIPFAELIFGVLLILGLLTRSISLLLLLMVGSFTFAVSEGHFVKLLEHGPGPFSGNVIILAVLIMLLFAGPGRVSLDRLFGGKASAEDLAEQDMERDQMP